jgi:hypothetical protein
MNIHPRLSHAIATVTIAMFLSLSAHAQRTDTIEAGRTTVKLAESFVSALSSLGVTPGTIRPTELKDGRVNFPITGGAFDLDTALGQVLHSGGLTLTAGNTEVRLQSFIIDTTGSAPLITGLVVVDGKLVGRLPLFNLSLPHGISLPIKPEYGVFREEDIGVTLTAGAASALNSAFHVSALTGGFEIGTANVLALLDWGY